MRGNLSLSWHEHHSTLVSLLQTFLGTNSLVDCTLAAQGKYLKAHRVILSACSPYFQTLFNQENEKNPIVILKDVPYQYLKMIIDFMYNGEVQVRETQLSTFLEVARSLQIKGLDARYEDAPQKAKQVLRSKRKRSAHQSKECDFSGQVDDDTSINCKVVSVVGGSDKVTMPIELQPERIITIESANNMVPCRNNTPSSSNNPANTETYEFPRYSSSVSVANSYVSNWADAVQEAGHSVERDSEDENILAVGSTDHQQPSQNNGVQCESDLKELHESDEEMEESASIVNCNDVKNSSGKRKQSSSAGSAERSSLRSPDFQRKGQEKLHRSQKPGRKPTRKPVTKVAQSSSQDSTDVLMESSTAAITANELRINPSDVCDKVLSVVLCRTKFPISASVSTSVKTPDEPIPPISASVSTSVKTPDEPIPPISAYVSTSVKPPDEPIPENSLVASSSKDEEPNVNRFVCPECHKVCPTSSSLRIHLRIHTGEKPFVCSYCNFRFADPSSLTRHVRIHTGEKPYVCRFCKTSFNRTGSHKAHERLHTGERPYKCTHCARMFVSQSHMYTHRRVHFGKYKCDECGARFNRKPLLIEHWHVAHGRNKIIPETTIVFDEKLQNVQQNTR